MMNNSTDEQWLQWIEVQKSATSIWFAGDLSGAVALIDKFVASNPPMDLKRQAIDFRGSLKREQGDLTAARVDFLAARDLTGNHYERSSLEASIAAVSYQLGDAAEAQSWYVEALRTAMNDPRSSGATALLGLLKLRGDAGLSAEERLIAEAVIRQAWLFHELPGSPDLHDLQASAQTIKRVQSTQREG